MKKTSALSFILIIALLFCGCSTRDKAVKSVISDFETAANAKDFTSLLSTLTPDTSESLSGLITNDESAFNSLSTYLPFLSQITSTTDSPKKISIKTGKITDDEDGGDIYAEAVVTVGIEGVKGTTDLSCYFVLTRIDGEWYIEEIVYLS